MVPAMSDAARDLIGFIDCAPTPYHAVAECARRLEAAGFEALSEAEAWPQEPGARHYVVRNEGSIAAFERGQARPAEAGFRLVGAHTDSPNLRLKPVADVSAQRLRQLAVEPYGGLLLHTWLDRDLSLAGRVMVREDGVTRMVLVDFGRALLRIPNLAIHLHRELREKGLELDAQKHAVPVLGLEDAPPLAELLAQELAAQGTARVAPEAIQAFDLMTYDVQPSTLSGVDGAFVHAPRLDNLASCHAALGALLDASAAGAADFTRGVVFYDHEEVGSRSAGGAGGTFLADLLERLSGAGHEALPRAIARSLLVSADMAHAVHPNYADRHEPGHRPHLGGGPVVKVNANQSYASDAATIGHFKALCADAGVAVQHFVTRSDLACGSTIGPISAARLGIRTVDVGNPMLSMHSCREMAATADVAPMIEVLRCFFERPIDMA